MHGRHTLPGILKALYFIVLASLLCSCSFHLRHHQLAELLPAQSHIINLVADHPKDPFARRLQEDLLAADIELVTDQVHAPLTVHVHNEHVHQHRVSISASTQVRQYLFIYEITYQLLDEHNHEMAPKQTIKAMRYYTQNQSRMLGSNNEQAQLQKEMIEELSQKLIERMQAQLLLFTHHTHHTHHENQHRST